MQNRVGQSSSPNPTILLASSANNIYTNYRRTPSMQQVVFRKKEMENKKYSMKLYHLRRTIKNLVYVKYYILIEIFVLEKWSSSR